uniref:Protein kinase domain-containing protein n=1 Tax=Aegilops tauschii subsp. strangulata TaxID=200361 RepID=A0A453P3X2_AEGTS
MLYRAAMRSGETAVRPACAVGADEAAAAARRIGAVTHPNLVPLRAVYVGPRGEKLLVHPFYAAGSLHRFLQGRKHFSALVVSLHMHTCAVFSSENHLQYWHFQPILVFHASLSFVLRYYSHDFLERHKRSIK